MPDHVKEIWDSYYPGIPMPEKLLENPNWNDCHIIWRDIDHFISGESPTIERSWYHGDPVNLIDSICDGIESYNDQRLIDHCKRREEQDERRENIC